LARALLAAKLRSKPLKRARGFYSMRCAIKEHRRTRQTLSASGLQRFIKSEQVHSAPWLVKQEMRRLDSLLMRAAEVARVPGGHALTVDRDVFSREIQTQSNRIRLSRFKRGEVERIPATGIVIIATGPLTSQAFANESATSQVPVGFIFTTALVSSWRLIRSTYQSRFAHHDMEIPSIARMIT
jgi:folate-dependent tRNA-U54 methylase TrmFO/GidA